jgi:predicted signal transduction protein with EAL and GGDEF domain
MREKIGNILKTTLVLFLAVLVVVMMREIRKIQGTAKVVNYAGLVRGGTQREVKLKVTGTADDELMAYLDDILDGLKYGDGIYGLVSLPDITYQNNLDEQISYWEKLKAEIISVREKGYEDTDVIAMSETYFKLADETVLIIIKQTIDDIRIKNKNQVLEKKAYVDLQTGLPNKSKCEEMLNNYEYITEPMGFVMFDLNNLKCANDTYGHAVGAMVCMCFSMLSGNKMIAGKQGLEKIKKSKSK